MRIARGIWNVYVERLYQHSDAEMADGPLNWLDHSPIRSAEVGPKYQLVGEDDGTFTVMNRNTGIPAIWNERMLCGLTFDEADDLMETMNLLNGENS
jgi:hypothetical protein